MIKIHYSLFLFMLSALFLNQLRIYLVFFLIILIHELSHLLVAKLLKFKVDKIELFPYGGVFNYEGKSKLEFLVIIAGPLSNLIMFFNNFYPEFNLIILLFNLIPVYPMDGFKLIEKIKILNSKLVYISLITIGLIAGVAIYFQSVTILFILTYLIYKNYTLFKERDLIKLKEIKNKLECN